MTTSVLVGMVAAIAENRRIRAAEALMKEAQDEASLVLGDRSLPPGEAIALAEAIVLDAEDAAAGLVFGRPPAQNFEKSTTN